MVGDRAAAARGRVHGGPAIPQRPRPVCTFALPAHRRDLTAPGVAARAGDPAAADGVRVRHAAACRDDRRRPRAASSWSASAEPCCARRSPMTLQGGRVRIHFKAPWRSGAAHADMSHSKFIARLCALVPPAGFHMTRYFGVFANRHHLRARIIPPSVVPAPEQQLTLGLVGAADDDDGDAPASSPRPSRIGWAKLLAPWRRVRPRTSLVRPRRSSRHDERREGAQLAQ